MRIVRILTRMNIGGPSVHAAILANELDPGRFQTCLIIGKTAPGEGERTHWVEGGPAKVVRMESLRRPPHPWADWVSLCRILRIVWKERPQIVHTHMAKAGALGRLAGIVYNRVGPGRRPGHRAILVHTYHGHVLEGYFSRGVSRLLTGVERWFSRYTDCLIAVSQTTQKDLLEKGIGKRDQWRVIPLGLDLKHLETLPLPNGSKPLRCGLVGRLVPVKNPSLFVQAIGQVAQRNPAGLLQGSIIGDGPLRPTLEETVRVGGLEQVISFVGWQEDLRQYYERLDVVCLTSWNEGTPVSVIEAMAAGRAAVATAVGGVRDLLGWPPSGEQTEILPGRFQVVQRGLLTRAGDPEGLAAALEYLSQDGALRRRLGETGRGYARTQFSHERLIRDISDLYENLVHGGALA